MSKYFSVKNTTHLVILLFCFLLMPAGASAQSVAFGMQNSMTVQRACDVYKEENGMVTMEVESAPVSADWTLETSLAGALGTGYYEWKTGNPSMGIDGSGQGVLDYEFEITDPGTYRFLFRASAPDTREHNDAWMRFPDNPGEARKSNGGSLDILNQNQWFKVYENKGGDKWAYEARTIDEDPHLIYAIIDAPGVYSVQLSGRSTMFKIDRIVLFKDTVSEETATDTNNPESGCSTLPVELTSFEGLADGDDVVLDWETASELNNAGFDVEFSADGGSTFAKVGYVAGAGTSNEATTYRFRHTPQGFAGQTVQYRLKQLDFDGTFEYSNAVSVSLLGGNAMKLHPAYPNPFNPETTLSFTLPTESQVTLTIHDATGRVVQELVNGVRQAGYHSEQFQANDRMASGLYMYRLVTPVQTLSGTFMLLK